LRSCDGYSFEGETPPEPAIREEDLRAAKFLYLAAGAGTLPAISQSAEGQAYPDTTDHDGRACPAERVGVAGAAGLSTRDLSCALKVQPSYADSTAVQFETENQYRG
jgi:hypothetical protein